MRRIFRCDLGKVSDGWTSYDELKGRHVVAQGWHATGDLSFLLEEQDFRPFLEYAAYKFFQGEVEKLERVFTVLMNGNPGDIFIATEGNTIRGICELPEKFTYVYMPGDETAEYGDDEYLEYAHCIFPVNWVDWDEFCPRIDKVCRSPGPLTMMRNPPNLMAFIEQNWDSYKQEHGTQEISEECSHLLDGILLEQPENIRKSRERYQQLLKIEENEMEHNKLCELFEESCNIILTGAPGTGKTYWAREIAAKMTKGVKEHIVNVQFHPSYSYSDFVEGLRPVKKGDYLGFERQDGELMKICRIAVDNPNDNFVVIIDEINRGDISKIFGELFSLIEKGYRTPRGNTDGIIGNGMLCAVRTQYNNLMDKDDIFKKGFFVPENVYIIGTMNDVDRSVESMDFAIRRRFVWHEVKPEDRFDAMWDAMWGETNVEGVDRASVKARMNTLNEKIKTDQSLGEAYQIGPSYFMKLKDLNGDYDRLWNQNLRLLLKEYLRGIPDAQKKLDDFHAILVKGSVE